MRPVVLLTLLFALPAREALACGATFVPGHESIEQITEQMIFSRENDKGVEHVLVRYEGLARDFAWVVPVAEAPEKVETSDAAIFRELQTLTAPRFLVHYDETTSSSGFCGGTSKSIDTPAVGGAIVDQLGGGTAGLYEWVAVSSNSTDALVEWLTARRFVVPEAAKARLQTYLDEGSKFLAVRLAVPPDTEFFSDVMELEPLKLTFPTFHPSLPLRMSGLTAAPDAGVLVYVLGDARAVPTGYAQVQPDLSGVVFDFSGPDNTNYRKILGDAIDAAGGRAFTTEYAGETSRLLPQAAGDATRKLLMKGRYLTRFYSVISPQKMTADAAFEIPAPGTLPDVSNEHWLDDAASGAIVIPPALIALITAAALRRRRERA